MRLVASLAVLALVSMAAACPDCPDSVTFGPVADCIMPGETYVPVPPPCPAGCPTGVIALLTPPPAGAECPGFPAGVCVFNFPDGQIVTMNTPPLPPGADPLNVDVGVWVAPPLAGYEFQATCIFEENGQQTHATAIYQQTEIVCAEAEDCMWDLDGDGLVHVPDLVELILHFGAPYRVEELVALLEDWNEEGC